MNLDDTQRKHASRIIFIAIIAVAMGQTVVFAILGPLGREVGLNEIQIGFIITCSSVIFSLFSPIWGRRSDVMGRKPVMIIGLIGYTLGTVFFASTFYAGLNGWMTGWWLFAALIFARMTQSLIMSATSPAATAYVSDITDVSNRTIGIGRIGAAHSIGTILGPAIAYFSIISLLAPIYMAAVMTFLAAILVMVYLPGLPIAKTTAVAKKKLRYTDKRILPFMVVGIAMFTGFSVVQQTLGYYFQDKLNLTAEVTAQQVGIAMMGSAIAALAMQLIVVQRLGWTPFRLMRMGLPFMLLGFVGLTLGRDLLEFVLAMALVGMGIGMSAPGFSAAATLAVEPGEQGAVAGLISACPALGFIVGPILGGALYQIYPTLPYIVSAVLFIPLVLFSWRMKGRGIA
jgi:MFS family permease